MKKVTVKDFKEYFRKYTKKESSLYRCLLSGECFSWEFSKEHFEYLKKNNFLK